jgi:hypothetical protein
MTFPITHHRRPAVPPKAGHQDAATPSRGLGDTVAKLATAVRADRVAKWFEIITRRPCGCEKRREALNRLLPY